MTVLAWLLLALMGLTALYIARPKPATKCPSCGGFKLPRAAACFDCTNH